jgi:hypothetical protein
MRIFPEAMAVTLVCLALGADSARAEVSLTFGGSLGAYTLPGEVEGYIGGDASTNSRFVWAESAPDEYGYVERTYHYKHPFPSKTLPNAGINLSLAWRFPSRLGFYIEGGRTFSILQKELDQSVPDTLLNDQSNIIPHDFRIRTSASNDRLYTKSFQLGLGFLYIVPIREKIRLILAGSVGRAFYSQYFRIETTEITTSYYQNNGNKVYSETDNHGSFEMFGIRYSAYCFKPSITTEWDLQRPLSLKIGLSYPFSLIEKGTYFTESNYFDSYSSVFYPSDRFVAGNVLLHVGLGLTFGKGGDRS